MTGRIPSFDKILASQLVLMFLCTAATAQPMHSADFEFHELKDGRWQGSCAARTAVFQTALFTIGPTQSITSGAWRRDGVPISVWSGVETDSGYVDSTMQIGGVPSPVRVKVANEYADSTIEIEIYAGGSGVLRSQDGWFAVTAFSKSAHMMRFQVDTSGEIQPSDLDRDIIVRSASILSSDSSWNRADNRECAPTATRWSIYCAMERATIEITGGFHHRRPALQLVRRIVEERTLGRAYAHRLMDYNNDPATRLEDIADLFAEALARMRR